MAEEPNDDFNGGVRPPVIADVVEGAGVVASIPFHLLEGFYGWLEDQGVEVRYEYDNNYDSPGGDN